MPKTSVPRTKGRNANLTCLGTCMCICLGAQPFLRRSLSVPYISRSSKATHVGLVSFKSGTSKRLGTQLVLPVAFLSCQAVSSGLPLWPRGSRQARSHQELELAVLVQLKKRDILLQMCLVVSTSRLHCLSSNLFDFRFGPVALLLFVL